MKTHDLIELSIDSLIHGAKIQAARDGEDNVIYHCFGVMRREVYMLASTIMDRCPEAMPSTWLVMMKQIRGDEDVVATDDLVEGNVAGEVNHVVG